MSKPLLTDLSKMTIADLEALQAEIIKVIELKRKGESYVPSDLDSAWLKTQGKRFPLTVKLTARVARQAQEINSQFG